MTWTKSAARAILPGFLFERIRAARWRRTVYRLQKEQGLLQAAAGYLEKNGATVRFGPFAGMAYPRRAALRRHSIPLLLGTYEQEVHPVIEKAAKRRYDLVIDIGCSDGYYAVGLARLLGTKVLAYDPEPMERVLSEEMARENGVSDLVELHALFRPSDVKKFGNRRVLCICDCEGFEEQIFTAETIADTARWDLLIELHGAAAEKVPALPWSQKTTQIPSRPRTGTYKELEGLGDGNALLSEYRDPQTWLWCDSEA